MSDFEYFFVRYECESCRQVEDIVHKINEGEGIFDKPDKPAGRNTQFIVKGICARCRDHDGPGWMYRPW